MKTIGRWSLPAEPFSWVSATVNSTFVELVQAIVGKIARRLLDLVDQQYPRVLRCHRLPERGWAPAWDRKNVRAFNLPSSRAVIRPHPLCPVQVGINFSKTRAARTSVRH